MVQPDGIADDLGGESMTIVRVGWKPHPASFAHHPATDQDRLP